MMRAFLAIIVFPGILAAAATAIYLIVKPPPETTVLAWPIVSVASRGFGALILLGCAALVYLMVLAEEAALIRRRLDLLRSMDGSLKDLVYVSSDEQKRQALSANSPSRKRDGAENETQQILVVVAIVVIVLGGMAGLLWFTMGR